MDLRRQNLWNSRSSWKQRRTRKKKTYHSVASSSACQKWKTGKDERLMRSDVKWKFEVESEQQNSWKLGPPFRILQVELHFLNQERHIRHEEKFSRTGIMTDRRRINGPPGGTVPPIYTATLTSRESILARRPTRNRAPEQPRKICKSILVSADG